jgi:hypothetical protein
VYPLLPLHYFSERKSLTNSLLYYFSAGKQERKLATYCSMLLPPYSFVFFFPSHLFHCLYQEKLLLKERETWNPATTHFLSCYICIYAQAIEMGIFMSCSFLFLFFEKKKLIFFFILLVSLGIFNRKVVGVFSLVLG